MRRLLNITTVGLSVSATLAVLYVALMLASLLLVGLLATGSWQAVFLGIGWSTVAGFLMGFLGIVIAGFAVAAVFVPIYNLLRHPAVTQPNLLARSDPWEGASVRSWPVRVLATCLVLPVLLLLTVRGLASAGTFAVAPKPAGATIQIPGELMQPVSLSPVINTAQREAEPSFTADGRTMYFNCNNSAICVSHLVGTWETGSWTTPEVLEAPINSEYEEVEPVINAAGDKLYFTSNRPGGALQGVPFLSPFINVATVVNYLSASRSRSYFGGLGMLDVWVSYKIDGVWSEPRNLRDVPGEPPINSPFADHCLFFSASGNEAFWTRPGGFGGNDIWTSRRIDGKWTEPENLGPNVNGTSSEHTSMPTPDGRSLYVTTTRDEGFGGEDNYLTTRGADGVWGPLVNLGPLVNGPGDDRCPAWTPDLRILVFDSKRGGGYGSKDIWWVYFEDVIGYPLAAASGSQTKLISAAQVPNDMMRQLP
jgi:hypothetical protein